tara:strand:+ start:259 stop:807 length:549 start_codon:yes stop_codon:yes gene_type:complete
MFTFEEKTTAKVQPKTAPKEAARKANVVLIDCKRTSTRIETFEGTDSKGETVKRLHVVDAKTKGSKGMVAGTWLYRVMKAHDSIEDVIEYLTKVVHVLAGMAPRQVAAPSALEFITPDDVDSNSVQGMQLAMLQMLGWPGNRVYKGMTADGSVYVATARTKDTSKFVRYDSYTEAFAAANRK